MKIVETMSKRAGLSVVRWWGWACLLAVVIGAPAGWGEELRLHAQLIWGTDGDKPKESYFKELDAKLKKKLARVFKWKNYFEISQQEAVLEGKEGRRLKMSSKCEIELRHLDEATLEIKLYGEGKLAKTIKQSVKPLLQGELSVLAGDDKEKYDDAWFVVISAVKPGS